MKRKVTITDIAKIAGVSKTTVSFYLNGKQDKMSESTRDAIQKAIEQTAYKPSVAARSLNSKKSHLLGVIIGDVTNEFANQVVRGIEKTANERSFLTIISSSGFKPEKEKELVLSMISMGVDGFIVQPSMEFDLMWKDLDVDIPIVYFDSPSSKDEQMYVKTDNYEVTYNATKKLIKKGYKRFVLVTKNPYNIQTTFERNKGCIDALEEANLEHDTIIVNSNTTVETLKRKLDPIIKNGEKICIFTFKSALLRMCYSIWEQYKHNSKIGLIGFDYCEWCELVNPSVSTIRQPAYEEGVAATKILFSAIYEEEIESEHQIIKSVIEERDSTNRL